MSESPQSAAVVSGAPDPVDRAAVPRTVLMLGVLITAASALALAAILGAYAVSSDVHPFFYGLALWGFPAGFALLLVYVVLSVRRRRGLRRTG